MVENNGGKRNLLRNFPGIKTIINRVNFALEQSNSALNESHSLNNRITNDETDIKELKEKLSLANQKIGQCEAIIDALKAQNEIIIKSQYASAISHRFAIKAINNIPIKTVFLLEEPSVTKNLMSIINELNNDERFDVIIVALWYKKYKKDNSFEFIRPDIESVINTSQFTIIDSYDPISDKWFDLSSIIPDYVFFSRPYDFYRQESYYIGTVSKYSRTCYVPYCIQTIGGEVERLLLTPECANLHYFFIDNSIRKDIIRDLLADTELTNNGHIVFCGYPGIDLMRINTQIKTVPDCYNILWLPRWNTGENNCHFFDYWRFLADYANALENCSVIFRPHPLCFNNLINRGELTETQLETIREKYSDPNEIDESSNYIDAFSRSSVLVADETSMIAEYFLTEKPIIFCKKEAHYSLLMEKLIEGCYVVSNQSELEEKLNELKNGNDPLKEKRIELNNRYLLNYENTAGSNIKEELLNDFLGKNVFK